MSEGVWDMCKHAIGGAILSLSITFASAGVMAQSSTFEPGVDRPGMDYTSFDLRGGPGACRESCLADRRCRAWTYVRAGFQGPAPRCWLKSARPDAQGSDCCASGIIRRF
jgi:hypothetical protein